MLVVFRKRIWHLLFTISWASDDSYGFIKKKFAPEI